MLGRCLPHIVPNVLLAKREVTNELLILQPSPNVPSATTAFMSTAAVFFLSCRSQFRIKSTYFSIAIHTVSLFSPHPIVLSLFCSVHSCLLLLFCMRLTAPIENDCTPLPGEWNTLAHIHVIPHSFITHVTFDLSVVWLFFSFSFYC